MNESELKSAFVKRIREEGGYGRRFEDQYAVGLPDMLLAPRGCRSGMLAEAKIIRGTQWGPSPRQWIELGRISQTPLLVLMVGYLPDDDTFRLVLPSPSIRREAGIHFPRKSRDYTRYLLQYESEYWNDRDADAPAPEAG